MRFISYGLCVIAALVSACVNDTDQTVDEPIGLPDVDNRDGIVVDPAVADALSADASDGPSDGEGPTEGTTDSGGDDTDSDAASDAALDAGSVPDAPADVGASEEVAPDDVEDDTTGLAAEVVAVRIEDNEINGLSPWLDVTLSDVAPLRVVARPSVGDPLVWNSRAPRERYRFLLPLTPDEVFTLSIEPQRGEAVEESYETAALPDDFPPMDVVVASEGRTGFTLFNVYRFTPAGDNQWGMAVVVNASGQPVWFYRATENIQDLGVSLSGNLIYGEGNLTGREITWSGELIETWQSRDFGVDTIHHEFHELDDGDLLFLSTELRVLPNHPAAPMGQAGDLYTVGDVIVRASRDGAVETAISAFDFLDPYEEFGPSSTLGFWDRWYLLRAPTTADWTHGNSVLEDPWDGHYIVSMRHMDRVVKLHATTGEVIWQLGPGGDLAPVAGTALPSHQHAPFVTGRDRVLVYDNGNLRPGDAHTRVVEYLIGDGTVEQTWEYRGTSPYLAPWVGDADVTADGTVLITDGGLLSDPNGSPFDPNNQKSARIREVTFDEEQEIVFELSIHDDRAENPVGYMIYRADRLSHLGPSP